MKRAAILCAVLFILAPLPVWGEEDISGELIQSYSELYGQQLEQGAGELLVAEFLMPRGLTCLSL